MLIYLIILKQILHLSIIFYVRDEKYSCYIVLIFIIVYLLSNKHLGLHLLETLVEQGQIILKGENFYVTLIFQMKKKRKNN